MLALHELQSAMRDAILGGDATAVLPAIAGDGLEPDDRVAIYRHHVFTTLTAVLEGTYPVVRRLVAPRFFAYAADQYIRAHPPTSPLLAEYGGVFPAFLAGFPPCRDLRYLSDIARLEWAITVARTADDAAPLEPARLAAVGVAVMPDLVFRLDPSVSLLTSEWPIDRIWRANQSDVDDSAVDLDAGPVWLEVRRLEGEPIARPLDGASYALRRGLLEGRVLAEAAAHALAIDAAFDLATAFRLLLDDGILIDYAVGPSHSRDR